MNLITRSNTMPKFNEIPNRDTEIDRDELQTHTRAKQIKRK